MSSEEAASPIQAVNVSQCDSTSLVWRTQDVVAARSLGLVGALLGSLPRTPRQNVRLGRPLLLLPEEERLLGQRGALTVVTAGSQSDVPEPVHQVALYEENLQRSYEQQRVLALQDRKAAVLRALGSLPTAGQSDCSP
ncbi:tRNA-splicing endonuclease subunit Sen34 [Festucalex cinctus]